MSSSAGKAPGDSNQGRKSNIGRAFKKMMLRMQGGSAKDSEQSINDDSTSMEVDHANSYDAESSKSSATRSSQAGSAPVFTREVDPQERARRLFAKYGLNIDTQEWRPSVAGSTAPPKVLRVEKPIRMRVRYTCHLCECSFGADRLCIRCQHRRCNNCPRTPSKRNRRRDDANKENAAKGDSDSDSAEKASGSRKRVNREAFQTPRQRTEGKSRATSDEPQPVPQQLQRYCHKCRTVFDHMAQLCNSCGHLRCSQCPRELSNWSLSGQQTEPLRPDRVYRETRQRIRWICDHCSNTFMEGSRVCAECLHKRCTDCSRIPPKMARSESAILHEPGIDSGS